jgi:hypothetical protein
VEGGADRLRQLRELGDGIDDLRASVTAVRDQTAADRSTNYATLE